MRLYQAWPVLNSEFLILNFIYHRQFFLVSTQSAIAGNEL
jgi:hypothetical protein